MVLCRGHEDYAIRLSAVFSEAHCMDNKVREPTKEAPEEAVRESLIAISNSLPEKVVDSERLPKTVKPEDRVKVAENDNAEKYRSELISISYYKPLDPSA